MLHAKTIHCTRLDGTTAEVTVRALPLSRIEAYLVAEPDPVAVVKLCTDADPETLHPGSTLEIADVAEELNSPFGERLLARAKRLNERYDEQPKAPVTPSPKSPLTSSPADAPPIGATPSP